MFAINFDPAAEARELAVSRTKKLMHTKPDRGVRRIEFVAFLCRSRNAEPTDYEHCDDIACKPVHKVILSEVKNLRSFLIPQKKQFQRCFASLNMTRDICVTGWNLISHSLSPPLRAFSTAACGKAAVARTNSPTPRPHCRGS